jgi:hypothetical protein
VDKETRDKHYRVVGTLEALERAANGAACMPCDTTTAALLDAIRGLANKATLSAWDYAERQTSESASTLDRDILMARP